ncbi:MAG: hypothetical protein PHW03_02670 [Eubacteriales bacterium]|nr:hypothetical protein [Eubacteriales bacterium]
MEKYKLLHHLQGLIDMYRKTCSIVPYNVRVRHLGVIEGILVALGGISIKKPFEYKQKEVTRRYYYVFFSLQRKEMREETYPEMIIRVAEEYLKENTKSNDL